MFRFRTDCRLENLTKPEIVDVTEYRLMPPIGCGMGAKLGKPESVRELDRQRVAGYDAVVLEADSTRALGKWLAEHEYVVTPELNAWLEPYVKGKWKITAFKIAKDATKEEIAGSAVRMSFATDRPFFPYSEPAEPRDANKHGGARLLRVFFLADQRFEGRFDKGSWPGEAAWAGPLQADAVQTLAGNTKLALPWQTVWLTVFDDRSSPRPGAMDVYFAPSASQEQVRRPPIRIVHYVDLGGWLCVGIALLLVLGPIVLMAWRSRRATTPS